VEKQCNGDDDNDTDINDDVGEALNDNDYHEPQPKNIDLVISHPSTSRIIMASKSHIIQGG
jgi:hypothetical protein